jgi:2-polyprenyl-3-methyl-5-hydroxy-6-metoxy-1,4-benzoquinol methylase
VTKAYSLNISEDYHDLCQSTAAGASSKDENINIQLILQVLTKTEIRSYGADEIHQPINWKKIQHDSNYLKSISSFILETISNNVHEPSYFDISHSESRFSHYKNKIISLFVKDKVNHQTQRWLDHTIKVFSWYFQKDLPAKNILSLGCGYGYELFFLRHKYPNAIITAIDWVNKVPGSILKKLDISFIETNVYDFLENHPDKFDLIYSSHVLEHSYKIDNLLNLLNKSLISGGVLASSLPLCGFEGTLYSNFLEKVLNGKSVLRQVDCNMLDLGHPWKTNQCDLFFSLQKAQFQNIEILGNEQNCVRGRRISFGRWKKEADFLFNLYSILLNSFKNIVYLFFKDPLPYSVVSFNTQLDWRFEFGGGRIANFVPEVFFTAYKK